MKKRYIFILFFALVTLVLVSCGNDVTPSSSTTSTTSLTTSIPTITSTSTTSSTSKTGGNMELPWV